MKVSNTEFERILFKCGGIYSLTARIIEKELGIKISRVAVRERALRNPDFLLEARETFFDEVESRLLEFIRSPNENISLKAIKLYLTLKGGERGYKRSYDVNVNGKVELGAVPNNEETIKALHNYLRLLGKEQKENIKKIA